MWTGRNPSNDVVELYELGNKKVMEWLKSLPGFEFIEIKEHTQISKDYEPNMWTCINRPEENLKHLEDEKK